MGKLQIRIPYGYLLSNTPFYMRGLGTMISPQLKNLYSPKCDSWQDYIFIQAVISDNTDYLLKIAESLVGSKLTKKYPESEKFNLIADTHILRDVFIRALSLFFINTIRYSEFDKAFLIFEKNNSQNLQGAITKDTFEIFCSVIEQLLHKEVKTEKKEEDLSNVSEEVLKALETFNKYSKQEKIDNYKNYQLENIISKMCAVNSGYNLLNIYELTVWQLYDQFQAYSQNRLSRISEKSFSVWGGDDFDFELWLKNNN